MDTGSFSYICTIVLLDSSVSAAHGEVRHPWISELKARSLP